MDTLFYGIDDEWKNILLDDEFSARQLKRVYSVLMKRGCVLCPKPDKWFEFARLTPFKNIKIVIIGQDPYQTKDFATGLAFSCNGKIPHSLRNIYKCLINKKLIGETPTTADLTHWASQGVLLINMALSTKLGVAGAHSTLWKQYMNNVIRLLCDRKKFLIFMLWGNNARKIKNYIPDQHRVLEWGHPSPLAQARLDAKKKFVNCDHFTIANSLLDPPIDWMPKKNYDFDGYDLPKAPTDLCKKRKMVYHDGYLRKFLNSTGRTHVFFTDGSCNPNNRSPESVGGYAALFVEGPKKDTVIYGSNNTEKHYASNNRAEGQAIISGLKYISTDWNWDSVIIITDSKLWVDLLTKWMPYWSEDKFEKKSNSDLTKLAWELWSVIKHNGKIATIKHVRGHNTAWKNREWGTWERYAAETNDHVDKLANYARKSLKRGEEIVEKRFT